MEERVWVIDSVAQMERLCGFLGGLALDRPKEIKLADYVPPRTSAQNARHWKLLSLAAAQTGHSTEEMHEFALMRHFGSREIQVGHLSMTVPIKRSSGRNVKEFSEFMEATEAWLATDFGVIL